MSKLQSTEKPSHRSRPEAHHRLGGRGTPTRAGTNVGYSHIILQQVQLSWMVGGGGLFGTILGRAPGSQTVSTFRHNCCRRTQSSLRTFTHSPIIIPYTPRPTSPLTRPSLTAQGIIEGIIGKQIGWVRWWICRVVVWFSEHWFVFFCVEEEFGVYTEFRFNAVGINQSWIKTSLM